MKRILYAASLVLAAVTFVHPSSATQIGETAHYAIHWCKNSELTIKNSDDLYWDEIKFDCNKDGNFQITRRQNHFLQ